MSVLLTEDYKDGKSGWRDRIACMTKTNVLFIAEYTVPASKKSNQLVLMKSLKIIAR